MLFICDSTTQEGAAQREFKGEGLTINFVSGSCYLGAFVGMWEDLKEWFTPQVEQWGEGIQYLYKVSA